MLTEFMGEEWDMYIIELKNIEAYEKEFVIFDGNPVYLLRNG